MMKKNKSTKPHPLPETTVIEQAYKSAQYRKNFWKCLEALLLC